MNQIVVSDYDLNSTLSSGQTFVWDYVNETWYGSTIRGVIKLIQKEDTIFWQTYPQNNDDILLHYYLQLDFDYNSFIAQTKKDEHISKSIKLFKGLRILKQDLVEVIVSYIISANNNIPSIKRSIKQLSLEYGVEHVVDNMSLYSFPELKTLASLSLDDWKRFSVGYRAKYLYSTVRKLASEGVSKYLSITDDWALFELLQELDGVGPKVADCVMCYGMSFVNVTPVDRWATRFLSQYYGVDEKLNYVKKRQWLQQNMYNHASLAGQYLFEMVRSS